MEKKKFSKYFYLGDGGVSLQQKNMGGDIQKKRNSNKSLEKGGETEKVRGSGYQMPFF